MDKMQGRRQALALTGSTDGPLSLAGRRGGCQLGARRGEVWSMKRKKARASSRRRESRWTTDLAAQGPPEASGPGWL